MVEVARRGPAPVAEELAPLVVQAANAERVVAVATREQEQVRRGGKREEWKWQDREQLEIRAREGSQVVGAVVGGAVFGEREHVRPGGRARVREQQPGDAEGHDVGREGGLEGALHGFAVLLCDLHGRVCFGFGFAGGADQGCVCFDGGPGGFDRPARGPRQVGVDQVVVLLGALLGQRFDGGPGGEADGAVPGKPFLATCWRAEGEADGLVADVEIAPVVVAETLAADFAAVLSQ